MKRFTYNKIDKLKEFWRSDKKKQSEILKDYTDLFSGGTFVMSFPTLLLPNGTLTQSVGTTFTGNNIFTIINGSGVTLQVPYKISFTIPSHGVDGNGSNGFALGVRDSISSIQQGIVTSVPFINPVCGNFIALGTYIGTSNQNLAPFYYTQAFNSNPVTGYTANTTVNTVYTIREDDVGRMSISVYDSGVGAYNAQNVYYYLQSNPLVGNIRSIFVYGYRASNAVLSITCTYNMVQNP